LLRQRHIAALEQSYCGPVFCKFSFGLRFEFETPGLWPICVIKKTFKFGLLLSQNWSFKAYKTYIIAIHFENCTKTKIHDVHLWLRLMLQTKVSNTLVISIKSLITLKLFGATFGIGGAIAPIAPPGYAPGHSWWVWSWGVLNGTPKIGWKGNHLKPVAICPA